MKPWPDPATLLLPREGHTSLVKELKETLSAKPGAIVLSVGGGGLLCGVVQGLREVGWEDVPIIAMETFGAHSFHEKCESGNHDSSSWDQRGEDQDELDLEMIFSRTLWGQP